MGLIGVIVFYVYKKSSGSLSFGDSRYQYSVLNSNLMDPDEDSNDPLITDFVRNDDDDNFLDISRYRYSDEDDVELLGVSVGCLINIRLRGSNVSGWTRRVSL